MFSAAQQEYAQCLFAVMNPPDLLDGQDEVLYSYTALIYPKEGESLDSLLD